MGPSYQLLQSSPMPPQPKVFKGSGQTGETPQTSTAAFIAGAPGCALVENPLLGRETRPLASLPASPSVSPGAGDAELACFHDELTTHLPKKSQFKMNIGMIVQRVMPMTEDQWQEVNNHISILLAGGKTIVIDHMDEKSLTSHLLSVSWGGDRFVLKIQKNDPETMSREELKKAEMELQNELSLLKELHNQTGIVRHYACGEVKNCAWILMEQAVCDLRDRGRENLVPGRQKSLEAAKNIVRGVKSLHEQNILHRDIKTENILCCDRGYKLTDLGYACRDGQADPTRVVGTRDCWAPECQVGNPLFSEQTQRWGKPADIWSLGLVFGELSGLTDETCGLFWLENGDPTVPSSIKTFYDNYRYITNENKILEQWVLELTGITFGQFINEKTPLPAFRHDISWEIQLCIAALACVRLKPEHRPTVEDLWRWCKGFKAPQQARPELSLPRPQPVRSRSCVIC